MSAVLLTRALSVTAATRRRTATLLLAVLPVVGVLAVPAAAAPAGVHRYVLSAAQERVVLQLVDDICGDTWCEGDHAVRFRSFACSPRRGCVLRVRLASWSQEPLRWQDRSARVLGFPRFRDMVATAPNGERSLRPAFYEAVGRAMNAMTASVR